MAVEYDLDQAIRKIPDFPKPGVLFYDITSILTNPEAFQYCIQRMIDYIDYIDDAGDSTLDGIAAVESRGFIFASPLVYELNLPLILLRKKGKLPGQTYRIRFELEYGEDELEVHKTDIKPGQKILLVDDLIATGGTLKAACRLIEQSGAQVVGIQAVVGLPFLKYEKILEGYSVRTLIQYHDE